MEDKEFNGLLKTARRRQTKKIVGIVSLFFLPLFISGGTYLYVYNYLPFQTNQVAGIRNNQLRSTEDALSASILLFDLLGQFSFNTDAQTLRVYVDYYERDELQSSQLVLATGGGDESSNTTNQAVDQGVNGELIVGIPKGQNNLEVALLQAAGHIQGTIELEKYQEQIENIGWVTVRQSYLPATTIVRGEKIYLFYIGASDKAYGDFEAALQPEILRAVPHSYVVYAQFE